jgi:hypothetical protein
MFMPSHADRVRRNYEDATREALAGPLAELSRFSGWLAKGHVSTAVRADVQALSAAIDAGHDTSLLMLTLDKDLVRLPGGDIRNMLRRSLGHVRVALEPGGAVVAAAAGKDA